VLICKSHPWRFLKETGSSERDRQVSINRHTSLFVDHVRTLSTSDGASSEPYLTYVQRTRISHERCAVLIITLNDTHLYRFARDQLSEKAMITQNASFNAGRCCKRRTRTVLHVNDDKLSAREHVPAFTCTSPGNPACHDE
jgi:hypothetical protein